MEEQQTNATWSTSGTGTFDNSSSMSAIYTPSASDITDGGVILTLTTNDPIGSCDAVVDDLTITINPSPEITVAVVVPRCFGLSDGYATSLCN